MRTTIIPWKMGVEVELLAPPGRSRLDLAEAIAAHYRGRCRRIFHPQAEPSTVVGTPVFENLTLGFMVEDAHGNVVGQCVDDLTLQDDLDRNRPPLPGWYRIVSDDVRLLRLTSIHADPTAPLDEVLRPIAALFGEEVQKGDDGMVRVSDAAGASIAIGARLPGERERACEVITPPIETDHLERLEVLLGLARDLDFGIPAEGATHLHFDAARLCSARAVSNLVTLLAAHGEILKDMVGTNPRCRRLGAMPTEMCELVAAPDFASLDWPEAKAKLQALGLTKYCDFNLQNLVHDAPGKHTFEVRILPASLAGETIVRAAALFAAILQWAVSEEADPKDGPSVFEGLTKGFGFN